MKFLNSLLCLLLTTSVSASEWVEDSFEDFRDGTFMDAGSNLYVSAKGRIQIINRWDLNGDGHLDVIIPSGHGQTEKEDIYIYLNTGKDISGQSMIRVPANGSRDGLVHDFNKDGWNDLAVCNNDNGTTDWTNSFVYYGGKDGYSANDRIELPAHACTGITAGDFNFDGWPDLALACQFDSGTLMDSAEVKKSFVYWNSAEGFDPEKRMEFSMEGRGAYAVATADIDKDGKDDLIQSLGHVFIYLSSMNQDAPLSQAIEIERGGDTLATGDVNGDGEVDILLGSASTVTILTYRDGKYSLDRSTELVGQVIDDIGVGDLNRDGYDDVVLANLTGPGGATWIDSYVYFSDKGEFSEENRVGLPTIGASGVSIGDLDGDGWPEIVFSNQRTTNLHKVLSYVYWNREGKFRFGDHTQLATQGTVGNTIGDVNYDGKPDIVFFNHEGFQRDGYAHTTIYWGDGSRDFQFERSLQIPSHYVTSLAHADVNDDGHVDLMMSQGRFMNGIPHEQHTIYLYMGGASGFHPQANLTQELSIGGIRLADLNRDGWLDLVGGESTDPNNPEVHGIAIYWGSEAGFTYKNRSVAPTPSNSFRGPLVMDLNRDGFLDLTTQVQKGSVLIYWGSEDGYSLDRAETIDLGREDVLMYVKGADFNRDGYLDLFLPLRQVGHQTELTSYLYYGSEDGFTRENRIEIPTFGPYDPSIADLNQDGWLDLVSNSYKGNFTRDKPTLIYYGGPDGFSVDNRVEIEGYASVGIETADYDADGWIDILSANHRKEGSTVEPGPHESSTISMLYWGGPDGFSEKARWDMPSIGPHALNIRDVGNSYDRGLYEDYESSAHQIPDGEAASSISWEAEKPHGTGVKFQIRTAETEDALEEQHWSGPDGIESWYTENDSPIDETSGDWIQYRARLESPNGGPTAYLNSVRITFK